MRKLRRLFAQENGIAMATVVMFIGVLTLLSVVLINQVIDESGSAAKALRSDAAYQAAEAGVNDYLAKLTEDPQYYDHYVAKGESTRRSDTGTLVAHSTSATPSVWKAGVNWTYPNNKDWWYAGTGTSAGNTTSLRGTAYNLMITPPSKALGTDYITIVSTGCKVVDTNASPLVCNTSTDTPERAVEIHVRRSTPADFQFMMDYDPTKYSPVCFGSTLYGKVYSTHSICFNSSGESYSDLMAEDYVTGISGSRLHSGRIYDKSHPNIRTVVKYPITFASLGDPSLDIKRSAATNTPSTDFEDSTAAAWRFNFSPDGTFQVWKCVFQGGSPDPASSQPFCGGDLTLSAGIASNTNISTVSINTNTAEFPVLSGSTYKIYIGTGSNTDSFSYSSTTSTSFKSSSSVKLAHSHVAGDKVSFVPGGAGVTWSVPWYSGPIPSNGAIYTGQTTVISWPNAITGYTSTSQDGSVTSKVNGRVTLATAGDIIIGGDIHYASEPASDGTGDTDDDVLGLIAKGDIWLPKYAPMNLWFRAATMSITGVWSDYNCTNKGAYRGDSSSLTFVGTSAYTNPSGCMQYSVVRWSSSGYNIDNVIRIADDGSAAEANASYGKYDALKFLFPPWFPVINGMETTVLFREVPSSYIPPAVS